MAKDTIFVIDIGSSKVSAALALCGKNKRIFDIFSESVRRPLVPRNNIIYSNDLSDIISRMKDSLEKKSSVKLQQVFVNVGSQFVNGQVSKAAFALVERSTRRVSNADVRRVEHYARSLGLRIDEELLHEFPLKFLIDSSISTLNPVGKLCRTIEVDLLLITSKTIGIDGLSKTVSRAGLKLKKAFFSGLASAVAVAGNRDKARSVAILDIGALTTKMASITEGYLRSIKVIPFAGQNITEGIASSLKISLDLAEELKKTYGSLMEEQLESSEDIMVKMANAYRPIKRSQVCQAILPKVDKLIALVKEVLDSSNQPVDCLYVCGGTALLDGFLEVFEGKISRPIILGSPVIDYLPVHKRNNFFKNPAQACLVGLLALALNRSVFTPLSQPASRDTQFLSRFIQKTKDIYNDYF